MYDLLYDGFIYVTNFLEQKHPDVIANTWTLPRRPDFHVGQVDHMAFMEKRQNRNLDDVDKLFACLISQTYTPIEAE